MNAPLRPRNIAALALLLACNLALADQQVRCESSGGKQQWCNADTSGGVKLTRQLSSAGCWQDQSWGWSSRGIWVSNGCRAEFQTWGRRDNRSGMSSGEQAAVGLLAIGILGAVIANSNDRDRDRTRDRDRYEDRYGSGYYPPASSYPRGGYYRSNGNVQPPVLVRCESRNNRSERCGVDTLRADVQISRQLSSANCQLGYNWGFDRNGIWVSNGCRAEFTVYYYR